MSKVSVIMPVYNAEKFVRQAVKSVLSQTYTDFEFLIYDDGCSDNSIKIIKNFNDNRIKIFSDGQNKGIVERLNFLIEKSQGEYIARIDADDIWCPEKLEKQIYFLQNNKKYKMVGAFARLIDDDGKAFKTKFKQYSTPDEVKRFLPNSNFIIHSSVVFRKSVFEKIGLYRNKYLHAEDYDLWLRMLENKIFFAILPNVLLDYRMSVYSVNFRFRKLQSKNVIRLKFHYWKTNGFRFFYLKELLINFYYLFFPYWIISLKHKFFNKYQS